VDQATALPFMIISGLVQLYLPKLTMSDPSTAPAIEPTLAAEIETNVAPRPAAAD
jgi:hypothetical protein